MYQKMYSCAWKLFGGLVLCLICAGNVVDHDPVRQLRQGFVTPPDSVRPGVYWYFMDGNRTREGMTADLEAMKRAGIGSVVFLEVNVGVPRGTVELFSPGWQEQFAYAIKETKRLGIDVILGIGPGWAGSGGPWVPAAQSMKHLVVSDVQLTGGSPQRITLPVPSPRNPYFGQGVLTPALRQEWNNYYEDVAVLAFPTPSGNGRITDIDEKALYYREPYTSKPGVKPYLIQDALLAGIPTSETVDTTAIIDLTSLLQPDGTLYWNVPAGNWTVMRFGSRNNGAVTRPAPLPGIGFEADKLDTAAIKDHLDTYVGKLLEKIGPTINDGSGGLVRLHMDSWEMGAQNWTSAFRKEFQQRRGYDPLPFYPVYTGLIVQNREVSERFLWDLRLTAQELVLENHAGYVKAYGRRHGLKLSIEPYDMNPLADLELGAVADVPMCEFWSHNYGYNGVFSCIEASSVAHVTGRSVVAAEAFTSYKNEAWRQYPGSMKNQGDWAFAAGVNQFMYHTFQHQSLPDSLRPGVTMGPYGVHWDRNQTWWHLSDAYHRYIARCSYILQQGHTVADILYLTPEGAPNVFVPPSSALEGDPFLADRRGYNFDGCSPDQLFKAEVVQHKIVFPGGAQYRVLVLPLVQTMTPELLTKIQALIKAGASVIGIPPRRSPGLANYPQCDARVGTLSKTLWGGEEVPQTLTVRRIGKGQIVWGGAASQPEANSLYPAYKQAEAFLVRQALEEDFTTNKPIRYIHQTNADWDLYFVSNRTDSVQEALCHFRTDRGQPELWDPLTGLTRKLPEFRLSGGRISIPIRFESYQSFFVVFPRKKTSGPVPKGRNFTPPETLARIEGPWEVSFDPVWGGPKSVTFPVLTDWTERPEEGIKHYSGSAVYHKTFMLNDIKSGNGRLLLDLGKVYNMARVKLNGRDLGVLWTAPWQVDLTGYIRPGKNELEVEVVNLWVNRLIGDQYLPDDGIRNGQWPDWLLSGQPHRRTRYTFTTFNPYTKDSPLMPSGLTGPVRILYKPDK